MTGTTFRTVHRDGSICLRLSIVYRLVFAGLAGITVAAMVAADAYSLFAFLLLALIAGVAVYDERWVFSRSDAPARRSAGTLLFRRTRTYAAEAIECLELVRFLKGSPASFPSDKLTQYRRHQVGLYLRLTDGTRVVIETRPSDHPFDLAETARDIARVSGLKLERSP